MVYRGKPSAGCENCRKAKKRCGLEQPSCSRCVKLKKTCSGYRDITQLQIQDESESVKLKANRQKARTPAPDGHRLVPPPLTRIQDGITTPETVSSTPPREGSSQVEEVIDVPFQTDNSLLDLDGFPVDELETVDLALTQGFAMPFSLKPHVDDVATTYFFNQFTASRGHWTFLREQAMRAQIDPLIGLAVRACGMVALDNVQGVVFGREYSRRLYAEALGLLNSALRDPKRCRTDESLIAVQMLGYYENLSCDSRESIQSWKAHISGATQLLRLRGKSQLKSQIGRMLFRETRVSIMIHCIWDDLEPPSFLWDWQDELRRQTPYQSEIQPADDMTLICFEFAQLQHKICHRRLSDPDALELAAQIEMKMVQWSIDAMSNSKAWNYYDLEVPDSPNVWNGVVHVYSEHPAASVWNTYRSMRIMLTRTQELLIRRFKLPEEQEMPQIAYLRSVRRQMTDDICAATPTQLGHASPAPNSPCVLITAYSSIWPLFFACTSVLERVAPNSWNELLHGDITKSCSAAVAQAYWLMSRLDCISKDIGLRWAEGVAATLRGDFSVYDDLGEVENKQIPPWIVKVGKSGRGPRVLLEPEGPLSDALEEPREEYGPIWLGRAFSETGERIDMAVDRARKTNKHFPMQSTMSTMES